MKHVAQLTAPQPPAFVAAADDDELLSPEKTASLLGWSLRTLSRRSDGEHGPRLIKLSPRRSGYRRGDIRKFMAACVAA